MRLLRRLVDRFVKTETTPPKCPACDSRLPLELVRPGRWFCSGCATEFGAIQDARGDWVYDREPIRYKLRRRRLSA